MVAGYTIHLVQYKYGILGWTVDCAWSMVGGYTIHQYRCSAVMRFTFFLPKLYPYKMEALFTGKAMGSGKACMNMFRLAT
jgi:hypothetical protein